MVKLIATVSRLKLNDLHLTLIAASADDVFLAGAFAGDLIAAPVVDRAECVASAPLASFRIVDVAIPKTGFASAGKRDVALKRRR